MHKQLKELLPKATGESQHVIVVIADIRGFSKFSNSTDSIYVATYISKIYIKLIELFSKIDENIYYKTTGDGLLITIPLNEDNLKKKYNQTVEICIKCHDDFASILNDIDIINFPIPDKVGFGISRGSACALKSIDDKTEESFILDYSGHKLNLAARLQDLARPSGVVLEGSKDINLLDSQTKKSFSEVEVFIKSIAEASPLKIWKTKTVKISQLNLKSLVGDWSKTTIKWTKKQFNNLSTLYELNLNKGTIIESTITVEMKRKKVETKDTNSFVVHVLEYNHDFSISYIADKPKLTLEIKTIKTDYIDFFEILSDRRYISFDINYKVI